MLKSAGTSTAATIGAINALLQVSRRQHPSDDRYQWVFRTKLELFLYITNFTYV